MIYMLPVRGAITTNCYFDIDDATGHGFLIDPGAEGERLARIIEKQGWTIEKILLTHGHFDHFGGVAELQRRLSLPVLIHTAGRSFLERPELNLSDWFGPALTLEPTACFQTGALLTLEHGETALEVLHTPGHTADSVTLYDRRRGTAFVGDAIFKDGYGELQHPTGDEDRLLDSIRTVILRLPGATSLLSGHSIPTTVEAELPRYR